MTWIRRKTFVKENTNLRSPAKIALLLCRKTINSEGASMAMSAALKGRLASASALSKCLENVPCKHARHAAPRVIHTTRAPTQRKHCPRTITGHQNLSGQFCGGLHRAVETVRGIGGARVMCMASANVRSEGEGAAVAGASESWCVLHIRLLHQGRLTHLDSSTEPHL